MSQTQQLPEWMNPTQRVTRMMVSENDKCTVVSILPKPIDERKHTVIPNRFQLVPGSYEKPSLLVVGPVSWWKDTYDGQPLLEIVSPSPVVAEAIVKDYCNGYPGSNGDSAGPGLFWLPGVVTLEDLKVKYKKAMEAAKQKQISWYQIMVTAADTIWARSNSNPMTISDDMRLAARELGISDKKDWMVNFKMEDMSQCPSCGFQVNPKFPVCANCKAVINEVRAKELGLKFVQ